MAPEQAEGHTRGVGPTADVWALGAILYELLTGGPPFKGVSYLETLEQVRTQEPVPPCKLRHKTPRELETVCLHCLQKDPKRRYSTAAGLAEDLRRFQAGEPVGARRTGWFERVSRWLMQPHVFASLFILMEIGIISIIVGALYRSSIEQRRATLEAQGRGGPPRSPGGSMSTCATTRR
jgi:serine/threonine protein kinase